MLGRDAPGEFTSMKARVWWHTNLCKIFLQYCVLQLEAAFKIIMQMYLLISTKINISVISIRISETIMGLSWEQKLVPC